MKTRAYALIILSAFLWGIISIFVNGLTDLGFSTIQIVALRVTISAILLGLYIAVHDRRLLKIRLRDSKYFIGTGILSIAFFNWCYFSAIRETSVAVAAILLYTSPAFVLLLSRVFFGESLGIGKMLALTATFIGCGFVVGILPTGLTESISPFGLATGIGAGFGYALYSIFGKFALRHYSALTVTLYTFIFATAAMLPASGLWQARALFASGSAIVYSLSFSLFSTVLSYLCYTVALSYVETGRAAIIVTLEPIVAAMVGTVWFGESLNGWQLFGIVMVIGAVISVQGQAAKKETSSCDKEDFLRHSRK